MNRFLAAIAALVALAGPCHGASTTLEVGANEGIVYRACTGTGAVGAATVGGVPGRYWSLDGKCSGFDYFDTYQDYFPAVVWSCGGTSDPRGHCIDMAYAMQGGLSWHNVVVPTAGRYQLDFKYASAKGLFPLLIDCDRPEAIVVNGVQVIDTMHFTRTAGDGDFTVFVHVFAVVMLKAGVNTVEMYNNGSDHGISRLDYMIVSSTTNPLTPANGGPTPACLFP